MTKLLKQVPIKVTVKVLTGLHIGAGGDQVKIGGIDSPVIKLHLKNDEPYIPGSSLKGKLGSLLEYSEGKIPAPNSKSAVHTLNFDTCINKDGYLECPVCKYFGVSADITNQTLEKYPNLVPITRLVFRDLELSQQDKERFNKLQADIAHQFYEAKTEVNIRRDTGAAMPREIERVPAGVTFEGTIVLKIFDIDLEQLGLPVNDEGIKKYLQQEIEPFLNKLKELLQNDYLGGHGSRGYGSVKVEFNVINMN